VLVATFGLVATVIVASKGRQATALEADRARSAALELAKSQQEAEALRQGTDIMNRIKMAAVERNHARIAQVYVGTLTSLQAVRASVQLMLNAALSGRPVDQGLEASLLAADGAVEAFGSDDLLTGLRECQSRLNVFSATSARISARAVSAGRNERSWPPPAEPDPELESMQEMANGIDEAIARVVSTVRAELGSHNATA
jgi:hypothetical protein